MILRYSQLQLILLLFFLLLTICHGAMNSIGNLDEIVQEGDLIFQTSESSQSQAIQLVTKSRYSHVGMIFKDDENVYVYEAIQPVKFTPLNEWIMHGKGGHYVVKRLKNSEKLLTPQKRLAMKEIAFGFLGKSDDLTFEWNDARMYCSEIIWKIYQRGAGIKIGKLERLGDFDFSHPVVQRKVTERYGGKIPLDEVVISPQSMFESPLLKTIIEN